MLSVRQWRQNRRFARIDRETVSYWRPSDKGGKLYLCPSCADRSPVGRVEFYGVSRAAMRDVPFYLAACRDCRRPL